MRKIDVTWHRLKHTHSHSLTQQHQLGDGLRIATEVRRHEYGSTGIDEIRRDSPGRLYGKCGRFDRVPTVRLTWARCDRCLQNLSCGHEVHGTFRVAVSEAQRAVHEFLYILRISNFIVVFR